MSGGMARNVIGCSMLEMESCNMLEGGMSSLPRPASAHEDE
jgi:hypothetical protein